MKAMVAQGGGKNISERSQNSSQLTSYIWFGSIIFILLLAWLNRHEGFINAERGIGYWCGITGGVMLLLLLGYSLRKRFKKRIKLFKLNLWFRFHMALGVLGPMFILLHSNFNLGSLNSTVALTCMLIVAGSGLAGRYLYTRIHHGLYGQKIQMKEITKNMQKVKSEMLTLAVTPQQKDYVEKLFDEITEFSSQVAAKNSFAAMSKQKRKAKSLTSALEQFTHRLIMYYNNRSQRREEVLKLQLSLKEDATQLLSSIRRMPSLYLFERLFSLWHVFHIPFFILMIITAITHVVVVHLY